MNLSLFDQQELFALARFDMSNNKYDAALEKIKFSLSAESYLIDMLALAGKVCASLQLFEKARDYFKAYIAQVPNAYVEIFQMGMVERDLGNISGCLDIWQEVLRIEQDYPDALFYLGETCARINKIEQAREWLLKLLETAPDNSPYIGMADQLLNNIKAH